MNAPPAVPDPGAEFGVSAAAGAAEVRDTRPVVLVVDDSRFVRASLLRNLSVRFRLAQAESGEHAWELLLLDPTIGAVLSDLGMPGIDGFELLRRVRGSLLERVRSLPFAVLSGTDDASHRARADELGADRFLVKGAAFGELEDWLVHRFDPSPGASFTRPARQAGRPASSPDLSQEAGDRGTPRAPIGLAFPTVARLVPDPLQRWFLAAVGRTAPGEAAPVLVRLHAPGLDELPARLRRGVRGADALHVDGVDTAWLCVPASAAVGLRLALRFGLLAAGRQASGAPGARIAVCVQPVEPARPLPALAAVQSSVPTPAVEPGIAVRVGDGAWGAPWRCDIPWAAVRLLVG